MDPTIPTTPTPTPTPTPEPKPEAIPAPLMGMDSAFEKPEPQPTAAVQPDIPTPVHAPAPAPTPINSMPTFSGGPAPTMPSGPVNPAYTSRPTPTIAATEPITEREPLPEPDPVAEALKAPITPAAPVPGSIGSAISVPKDAGGAAAEKAAPVVETPAATTPASPEPIPTPVAPTPTMEAQPIPTPEMPASAPSLAQNPAVPVATPVVNSNTIDNKSVSFESPIEGASATPKKKSSKLMTILIIVGAVIIVALAVLLVVMLLNNGSDSAKAEEPQETPSVAYATLSCQRKLADSELLGYGNAVSGEETLIADYADEKLTNITSGYSIKYENASNASIGKDKFRSDYVNKFKGLGIETDPFNSEYSLDGVELEVTHDAILKEIDEDNMKIFNLGLAKDSTIDTSLATIKKTYQKLGLTCTEE